MSGLEQIAKEIKLACIEAYDKERGVNIAEVIYDYIEENREFLENNVDYPMDDEDTFAEEIGMLIDEEEVITEAEANMLLKGYN